MRWFNIDFEKHVFNILGKEYDYNNTWLSILIHPVVQLWRGSANTQGWDEYRREQFYNVNVTGQTLSLQGHLSKKFGGQFQVRHFKNLGFVIYGKNEGYAAIRLNGTPIFKKGEQQEMLSVDFMVKCPEGVNKEAVKAEVLKYKLAGKTFNIS